MHFFIPAIATLPELQARIDGKTKPPGSLGQLERLALQIGSLQQSLSPCVDRPHLLVFAGDHGAACAGVSAYPQEVTWQMVDNFLAGGAAINVFARHNGLALQIIDAGVAHDFGARAGLIDAKIGFGTRNYLEQAAMNAAETTAALERGAAIVRDLADQGCRVLAFGEMGIGNTASASLITHALTGTPLVDCIGRGTGLDDTGLARKRELLARDVPKLIDLLVAADDADGLMADLDGNPATPDERLDARRYKLKLLNDLKARQTAVDLDAQAEAVYDALARRRSERAAAEAEAILRASVRGYGAGAAAYDGDDGLFAEDDDDADD